MKGNIFDWNEFVLFLSLFCRELKTGRSKTICFALSGLHHFLDVGSFFMVPWFNSRVWSDWLVLFFYRVEQFARSFSFQVQNQCHTSLYLFPSDSWTQILQFWSIDHQNWLSQILLPLFHQNPVFIPETYMKNQYK